MVKKITRDELVRIMESGDNFDLVDVLPKESYEKEHIKGAISLPLADIDKLSGKLLKKNDLVITYCASFECQASTNAAEKLAALGYTNVLDYKGGLKDYKEANLPMEGSAFKAAQNCCCCDKPK